MSPETVKRIMDPLQQAGQTPGWIRNSLLKLAAESSNGWLEMNSELGKGTKVTVQFQHSHIDRMPWATSQNTAHCSYALRCELGFCSKKRQDVLFRR